MTSEHENAKRALTEGFEHFDNYPPIPSDDTPVMAFYDNTLFEFATENGQLTVGHLRDALQALRELP